MNGLSSINVELTSRCNKSCWMCGRRKIEKERPELANWGDMPLEMVVDIAGQVPPGVFVQLHNNGEPLLYPHLTEALVYFKGSGPRHVSLNTNGKLLVRQFWPVSMELASVAISIIPDDPEGQEQLSIVEQYLMAKKSFPQPIVILRLLGEIDHPRMVDIDAMVKTYGCLIARRVLHSPDGSHDYEKPVTIPEIGVCLEMLHRLSIDRFGNVSPCVRFDPEGENVLGNINKSTLDEIWNGAQRKEWLQCHIEGRRDKVPLCSLCDYWGIPRG